MSQLRESAPILEVRGLCKRYPSFSLEDVSFSLARGRITGFIGRNGAGKSTTLKSLLGFVHADAGEILFSGRPFAEREREIRREIGFVSGGMREYANKRLSTITSVTKSFYPNWDDDAYADCMRRFALDERKTPAQLSSGMQVKYSIALALSHHAELLILDEPTSGLDPVSREDLLELLLTLSREGKTVLFSTHITSDLDLCADDIIYIRGGRIFDACPIDAFVGRYLVAEYEEATLTEAQRAVLIGERIGKSACRALIPSERAALFSASQLCRADLEAVMVHLEKEGE